MDRKTLTFLLMDPPFESSNVVSAFRMIHSALNKGMNVNVFAYEGAVFLPLRTQKGHLNLEHGHSTPEEEDHPLSREWIASLQRVAADNDLSFKWINCGLCVAERGAEDAIDGVEVGKPADFWAMHQSSDNTIVIPTR